MVAKFRSSYVKGPPPPWSKFYHKLSSSTTGTPMARQHHNPKSEANLDEANRRLPLGSHDGRLRAYGVTRYVFGCSPRFGVLLHVLAGAGVFHSGGSILVRILGLAIVASSALFAQPAATPRFEVASVKRAEPNPGVTPCLCEPAGKIAYKLAPMRLIIERAYNVKSSPQVEGPAWLDGERYDVDAALPEGARQEVPAMLRALLAERFKLSTHTVTREAPSLALVVDKAGSKLTPARDGGGYSRKEDGAGVHLQQNMPLANLAHFLSNQLQTPVMDETGLGGSFWIALDFAPEYLLNRQDASARARALAPPLLVAVEEQLGLKVESRKAPVEFLVIDHIEKVPTDN
jgi:uncharacterized protein (TIGR03435 family)